MRTDRLHRPVGDLVAALGLSVNQDLSLWEQAVTHPSYAAEHPERPHYERLEFLGDAVLKQQVAEWLHETFPRDTEGQLSKVLHRLVSNAVLAEVARELDLPSYLRLGRGEERTGGRERPGTAAGALEAVLGVVHLTQGHGTVRIIVRRLLETRLAAIHEAPDAENPKVLLAEWAQRHLAVLPIYATLREVAVSANQHHFEVEVRLEGKVMGRGEGSSRKAAEQAAARMALRAMERPPVARRASRRARTDRLPPP
ncbi:MAG: ribonuclease III [Candidatus Sericytochromatia bacterium]|nr:ribonuclease III [Candidatus Sericytochromatia bacterium]